jgi:hypothetical protein
MSICNVLERIVEDLYREWNEYTKHSPDVPVNEHSNEIEKLFAIYKKLKYTGDLIQ